MSDLVDNVASLPDQTTESGDGILTQTVAPVAGIFHKSDSDSDEKDPDSTDADSTDTLSSSVELYVTENGRIYPASSGHGNSTGSENPLASHLWAEADSACGSITPPPSPLYATIDGRDHEHHTWDNGRRCHKYYREESPYYLPNDGAEQERMNLVHEMFKLLLNGKLCSAPIGDPRHVIDVGTGTGIWAIEFADNYPNTSVTGTDLSPIQPGSVPLKVQFELIDCSSTWDFDSKFDFVFIREALSWVRDWRKFLGQAYNAMEPGAIIEFQNIHFPWRSESFCLDDSDPEQHSRYLVAGASKLGIDLRADENLEERLNQAGFINYKEWTFTLCTSYTGENKTKRRLSNLNLRNLLDGLDAYSKGFMVHGLDLSPEQVELSLVEVRRRLSSKKNPVWVSASVCYAQKPVLEASTCYERQLSGVSEEPTLGPSPLFESPGLLELLDCPWQECHQKGQNGVMKRAHLSGHLSEYHGEGRLFCPHEDCRDSTGRSNRLFKRKADVSRHLKSMHNNAFLNCPKRKCERKGLNGFTRRDHLVEHLRKYHGEKIPKRHWGLREPGTH